MTEHSFHGIHFPPPQKGESVTYVSGTICYLCVGSFIQILAKSPGHRGLPKGLKLASPARVALKTHATPLLQPCSQLQLSLPTRGDRRHFGSRRRWRVPCCPASL